MTTIRTGLSSPIMEVKGQGHQGQKNALSAAITHMGVCEWYVLAASAMQQIRAAPADERISWRARGDISGVVQ